MIVFESKVSSRTIQAGKIIVQVRRIHSFHFEQCPHEATPYFRADFIFRFLLRL